MKHFKTHYKLTSHWVTCIYHTTILPISHVLADAGCTSHPTKCNNCIHAPFLDPMYAITVQLVHAYPPPCMPMCLLVIHEIRATIQNSGLTHGHYKHMMALEWHVDHVGCNRQHMIISLSLPLIHNDHGCALSMHYRASATCCAQTRS